MPTLRQLLGFERRPGRLGWAFLLRPEGMEDRDRRFNRWFLVEYALAGSVGLAVWVRTATYCSNHARLDDPRYRCPSDARIATIWVALAVTVLAMFASRFLIMRKVRWSYVPLALVPVVALCVVGWLAIHHPHYGLR